MWIFFYVKYNVEVNYILMSDSSLVYVDDLFYVLLVDVEVIF